MLLSRRFGLQLETRIIVASCRTVLQLGMLGLISNYQMLYGTVIYFSSFIFNRRYRGLTPTEIALFVGCTNGLWFALPLLGMHPVPFPYFHLLNFLIVFNLLMLSYAIVPLASWPLAVLRLALTWCTDGR